jgi:hypothetical protein
VNTIRLAVNRKEGAPNYGSNGASCEVSIDLPEDFSVEMTTAVANIWYVAITNAVDTQLSKMRQPAATPPAEPERQPEPERPRYPERRRNDGGQWQGSGPPRTGRELLGWARKHDVDLSGLAKAWRLPWRVMDWSEQDVQDAYNTLSEGVQSNGKP